ncbi:KAP family P-loop NTPase fold protein [Paraburkholderia adhaesiva]|uniref:KAP family P-loop NTPase fold protein n=1 Tax=Paraburkholderia adhaesiva TaxID=2883244 RepID=UPI001F476C07|nr:KAP family NTPase [Paraburkholderia adhaesiva]
MKAAGKDRLEIEPTLEVPIGSDAPQFHPSFDAFGYAPFAQAIASAVRAIQSPRGLVMAIDGPWGAGKTSLLNFVRHYLSSPTPEEATARIDAPVVLVDFNPWWFADKEQLAMQFLVQFRARFPAENPVLMAVADAFAEYADAIGTAVAASISAGAGVPIPLSKQVVSWLFSRFRRAPKDVHKLKAEISDALSKAGPRFVVFVDDIDRLAPEEIREAFKVIKAVADFPNVVYLLAFDRHLVSEALASSLGLEDGDAYLEKIVQAQFALPVVSHDLLIQKFAEDLERLVAPPSQDDIPVEPTYWGNVLHDGISPLLETPRDVVRAVNALLVTFPHLRGEVNPVDFIALECLRVFVPDAYAVIRDNKQKFSGIARERDERETERTFHQGWLDLVAARHREPVQALVRRLFPRLQSVCGNVFYGAESQTTWSAQARVCDPEKFDRYFQFAVSPHVLSERELRSFIALDADVEALAEAWTAANDERRPHGTGKANDLIEALIKRDDLPEPFAMACLASFFEVGDRFIGDPRNTIRHFFSIRPEIQAYWLIHHLTKLLPEADRETTIVERVRGGRAIVLACQTAHSIARMHQPDATERDSVFQQFADATVQQLKGIAVERVRDSANAGRLGQLPDTHFLLRLWRTWGDPAEAQQWFRQAFENDDELLHLLVDSVQVGSIETAGDRVARRTVSVNPRIFEPYLSPPVDLENLATRVSAIAERGQLDESGIEAVRAFEAGMVLIRNGRSPDDPFARIGL